jgi:DNA-binding NtrC family response regulator
MCIRDRGDDSYTIFGKVIQVGDEKLCAYRIEKSPVLKDMKKVFVNFYHQKTPHPFEDCFGTSESAQNFLRVAEQLAASSCAVLICGEQGSNFDETAFYIHLHSTFAESSFAQIDCERIPNKQYEFLFTDKKSPLFTKGCTFYFKGIDVLTSKQQEYVIAYLYGSARSENRFIFSLQKDNEAFCRKPLYRYLCEYMNCGNIRILPIREQPNGIPSICASYINLLNISMGKQIVGLTLEAQMLVREYSWPGNRVQLRRVMQSAMMSCTSMYITDEDIKTALRTEALEVGWSAKLDLNLNQPLSEITRDIISNVLAEEGMNQSKAAQRLGISRSTLWRILNNK